jgi:hypothetical protein
VSLGRIDESPMVDAMLYAENVDIVGTYETLEAAACDLTELV